MPKPRRRGTGPLKWWAIFKALLGEADAVSGALRILKHLVASLAAVITVGLAVVDRLGLAWTVVLALVAFLAVEAILGLSLFGFQRWKLRRPALRSVRGTARQYATFGFTGEPRVYVAISRKVENLGGRTNLSDWKVAITPPGSNTTLLGRVFEEREWDEVRPHIQEIMAHLARPLYAGSTLHLSPHDVEEFSVIGVVDGLNEHDIDRLGTKIVVGCVDSYGKEWWFGHETQARHPLDQSFRRTIPPTRADGD